MVAVRTALCCDAHARVRSTRRLPSNYVTNGIRITYGVRRIVLISIAPKYYVVKNNQP